MARAAAVSMAFLAAAALCAQTRLLPLAEVKAGMRGTGRTVFQGGKVEEFPVEILGVLENAGPKQSIILGRLSGPLLERAGVMQGMSGSPVYVEGKLVGAVALAFAYSKEPIAGIRPIEEMLRSGAYGPGGGRQLQARSLEELAAERTGVTTGGARMIDIATPLGMAGFTARTIEQFTPQLRALGLEPMQGTLGGASRREPSAAAGAGKLEPGSMISVQLVTGDLSVGADGTVTHIDGNRVYAFGHRFMSVGPTDLPFARSEVLTVLPNVNTSFKISAAREWMGSITGDYSAAISGQLGRKPAMIPVTLDVKGRERYAFQIVDDRLLAPFFLQVATYSAMDATERLNGAGAITVGGTIEFAGGRRVRVDNVYSADTGTPVLASLAASIPLSYAMQSGFPEFRVRNVALAVSAADAKKQYQLDQLWPSRSIVRPGEAVDLHVTLTGPGGVEVRRTATYRVPVGIKPGTLQVTASDAMSTNVADYAHILQQPPNTAEQVHKVLTGLRANDTLTLRVWRTDAGYLVQGQHLPAPPPSLALLLKRTPGLAQAGTSSRLAEFDFRQDSVVNGTRTTQLEVRE